MDKIILDNLEQFHNIFRRFRSHDGLGSWFRGQSDIDWDLLPKAGRKSFLLPDNRDLGRFNDWATDAIAYSELPNSELEKLAIAQHHGLATRLLDWTKNPLVAAFFSVISNPKKDGAIFILEIPNVLCKNNISLEKLKEHNGVLGYIPRSITQRVINQKGLFTVHCPANKEIEISDSRIARKTKNLTKIQIPAGIKLDIEKMLDDYGINWQTLFPDLDGLSKHKDRQTDLMIKNHLAP